MIDDEKTSQLRERLKSLPNEEGSKTSEVAKAIGALLMHITQILFFWGAQTFILNKVGVQPFGFWESLVIFETIAFLKK